MESNVGGLKQGSFENTGSASLMVRPVLGAVLLLGAGGLIVWLVKLVHRLLYTPDQIPLLQRILDTATGGGLSITGKFNDGELAITAPTMLKYAFFVLICLILLSTLGRIACAMLSGAINLFTNRTPR